MLGLLLFPLMSASLVLSISRRWCDGARWLLCSLRLREPSRGYFVIVVLPGVILGMFANWSETKGFKEKICSSASTVLED